MSAYTITLQTIASLTGIATSTSLIIAYRQFRLATRNSQMAFEDALAREYRAVAGRLPLGALLGEAMREEELRAALPHFYWYFDLTNEQVFLRRHRRVSDLTWRNWAGGIAGNMAHPAFARAWAEIDARPGRPFADLRRFIEDAMLSDPARWEGGVRRAVSEPVSTNDRAASAHWPCGPRRAGRGVAGGLKTALRGQGGSGLSKNDERNEKPNERPWAERRSRLRREDARP